jgi:heme-degrading monooxygenase HmoA
MALVSLTRLRLRSWRCLPAFGLWVLASLWQSLRTEGLQGLLLLRDQHNTYWTLSLWRDQVCMESFRRQGSHGQAMRHIGEWCYEAAVGHWPASGPELQQLTRPDWCALRDRLMEQGHFTPLPHASEEHRQRTLAVPACGRGRVIRLR